MKRVVKSISLVVVFLFSILVFLPKESIYFFIEKKLSENGAILSNEQINSTFSGFEIKGADIFYQNIAIANVDKISVKSYLFISDIKVKDIRLMESLQSFAPALINEVNIKYSIFSFKNIKIDSFGDFGTLNGNINLVNRVLYLELTPSNKMRNIYGNVLSNMRFKDGKYIYEYKF